MPPGSLLFVLTEQNTGKCYKMRIIIIIIIIIASRTGKQYYNYQLIIGNTPLIKLEPVL